MCLIYMYIGQMWHITKEERYKGNVSEQCKNTIVRNGYIFITTTAFVPKGIAIKMNLLL